MTVPAKTAALIGRLVTPAADGAPSFRKVDYRGHGLSSPSRQTGPASDPPPLGKAGWMQAKEGERRQKEAAMAKPNLNPVPQAEKAMSKSKLQAADCTATSFVDRCREFAEQGTGDEFGLSGEAIEAFRRDVVPRLMLIQSERLQEAASHFRLSTADETDFLNSLLTQSLSENADHLERLRIRRRVDQAQMLEFLGATARRLGELWEEDEGSFAEVSVALCRLHPCTPSCANCRRKPIWAEWFRTGLECPRSCLQTPRANSTSSV